MPASTVTSSGCRTRRWVATAGLALSLLLAAAADGHAQSERADKAGKLPRFASLKSDDVNVRTGPGPRYPVDWKFVRRDMPVEIVAEFETWQKIRDWEGTEGWVHQSMLSARRHVLVTGDKPQDLYRKPETDSTVVARTEPGVVGQLQQCEANWCRVQMRKVTGWVRRDAIWGVYADEDMK